MKLKVLTVGNSFSLCLKKNLPQIVKADKKHQLVLTSAYIGGCSLQLHAEHLQSAEKDPAFAPYHISVLYSEDGRKHFQKYGNVLELLKNQQFDVISIQQASILSWDLSTYQPYAGIVIDYIRKYNPQAKIIVQQTWSYRSDHSCFGSRGGEWEFDSEGMYSRLRKAYGTFAQKNGFDIIPVGDAVQLFRKKSRRIYKPLSPAQLSQFRSPDLPPSAGDIVGSFAWMKNSESEMILTADASHLNVRGEYLQACVWYGKLFGEDPEKICWENPHVGRSECKLMQTCAKEALAQAR